MEPLTIDINPLVALWTITIVGGVVCIGRGLLNAASHSYKRFEDAITEQGGIVYGALFLVVAIASWVLWDSYYAC